MSGRPVLPGTVQVASRLVVLSEGAHTVGAAGATGTSTALSTLMVTAIMSVPP